MKIAITLRSLYEVNDYMDADIFIVSDESVSTKRFGSFSKKEIKELKNICLKNSKELFFSLNIICHNYHIGIITDYFNFLKEIDVDGIYVSDVGLIQLASDMNIADKIIYNPETLITNTYDTNFYLKKNIKAVSISKEITLEDTKEIIKNSYGKLDILIHGVMSMYYSKRPILKNFLDYRGNDIDLNNSYDVSIVEEKRNETYPILEDEHGSWIFRNETICLLKFLDELEGIDYIRIDGIFKSSRYLRYVLSKYREFMQLKDDNLKNNLVIEFEKKLKDEFNDKVDYGFFFKKTIYKSR